MAIRLENVNYIYSPDSAFKKQALKDVNLTIHDGEFIGLIGHTGSGKSTLIQHLNGLVRATSGNIYFNDTDIYDEKFVMKNLRAKVGLVFQYPEHQLFEVTVMKDVCFGPHNLGLSDEECEARAKEARKFVDRMITYGKDGSLVARRKALAFLHNDKDVVSKVFNELAPKYKDRNGGYTRIIKLKERVGDDALTVKLELV